MIQSALEGIVDSCNYPAIEKIEEGNEMTCGFAHCHLIPSLIATVDSETNSKYPEKYRSELKDTFQVVRI